MAITRVQGSLIGTAASTNTAVQLGSAIIATSNTIYNSYTFQTNENGYSVGPVTINNGVSITLGSGARWVIM
jgi:hypothetical protein